MYTCVAYCTHIHHFIKACTAVQAVETCTAVQAVAKANSQSNGNAKFQPRWLRKL